VGTVGTALQFNLEVDRILWLRETYKTDSEDQESAYAAGVAMAMRTPFVALRVISDTVFHDPVLDKSLGRLVGEFALSLVAELA
jgi:adenosylhomocysteine nucleosidase